MSYSAARTTIMTHWDTQWKLLNPLIPYAHDNARFSPPLADPWVRISILDGDSNQISFGAGDKGNHRHVGLISIEIFVPLGTGEAQARTLLDQALGVFRAVQLSSIICRAPRMSPGSETQSYYRMSAVVPFQRDEVFS